MYLLQIFISKQSLHLETLITTLNGSQLMKYKINTELTQLYHFLHKCIKGTKLIIESDEWNNILFIVF